MAALARPRSKIEDESLNVLKNNGCNLAHNFGHGRKYLAGMFAAMNLLAFAFHAACLETRGNKPARISGHSRWLLPGTPHHLRQRRLPHMDQPHYYARLRQGSGIVTHRDYAILRNLFPQ
jgi:hypothetical protein